MKFTLSTMLAAFCAITCVAASDHALDVSLDVDCDGLDYQSLSASALADLAKALEVSFNAVHHLDYGYMLDQVASHGAIETSGQEQLATTSSGLRATGRKDAALGRGGGCRLCGGDQELTWARTTTGESCNFCAENDVYDGLTLSFSAVAYDTMLGRGGGCRLCGGDEVLERGGGCRLCGGDVFPMLGGGGGCRLCGGDEYLQQQEQDVLQRGGGCRLCGGDVLAMLQRGGGCRLCGGDQFTSPMLGRGGGCRLCGGDEYLDSAEMTARSAWESNFASMLAKSADAAFKNVKTCRIQINDNKPKAQQYPVGIHVACEDVRFEELPFRALSYSTKALEAAYNSIHTAFDGSTLQNVALTGPRLFDPVDMHLERGGGCRLCGGDVIGLHYSSTMLGRGGGCRLCGGDLTLEDQKMLTAWEDLFVAYLHKDPMAEFQQVKQCKIGFDAESQHGAAQTA